MVSANRRRASGPMPYMATSLMVSCMTAGNGAKGSAVEAWALAGISSTRDKVNSPQFLIQICLMWWPDCL